MSLIAHLIVICVGFALLLAFCVLRGRRKHRKPSAVLLTLLAGGALLFLAAPLVLLWLSSMIAHEANEAAGNEAYCVQVAEMGKGYRPVAALLDLSPLTMHASWSNGVNLQFRALLVVGRGARLRIYNWSYRSFSFVTGQVWDGAPVGGPTIRCSPTVRFAELLPFVAFDEERTRYIRLNNYEFRIPSEYQPDPISGDHPTITVSAFPPESALLPQSGDRPNNRPIVEIQLVPTTPLEKSAHMSERTEGKEIVKQSSEYGLQKVSYGWDGKASLVAYSLDRNGTTETLIVCDVPSAKPARCQHYLLHEGIQYWFFYDSNLVKDWSEMQSKLIATVQRWRVRS